MTSLNEDLPQLQQEVQRLLGRCLLRLQQYEQLVKILVAHHSLAEPVHDLEQIRAARIDGAARKTLGSLVGELVGSYVLPDGDKSTEGETTEALEAANGFAMHISLRLPATEFAQVERELKELVDLRNNLVHHFLDQHDIESADGCRGAQEALVKAESLIDHHLTQLRGWAKDTQNARQALADAMQTQAGRDLLFNGISPDGTVNWVASGIASSLRRAFEVLVDDGWASLAEAENWIVAQQPDQQPSKYGCKSWRQVVHKVPDLELQYFVINGERSAFYRPHTSTSKSR